MIHLYDAFKVVKFMETESQRTGQMNSKSTAEWKNKEKGNITCDAQPRREHCLRVDLDIQPRNANH